jgi:hypothetical protein
VNEESRIMNPSKKTNNCDHRAKALKPSLRCLIKAIKEDIGDKSYPQGQNTHVVDACKSPHVAKIKKDILYIKAE